MTVRLCISNKGEQVEIIQTAAVGKVGWAGIFLAMGPASPPGAPRPFYPMRREIRNEIMHSSSASTDTERKKKKT